MPERIRISDVQLARAAYQDQATGLLGWISFVVNEAIRHDGVALRVSATGKPYLAFPARRDSDGNDHAIVRPINDAARREVERQVFEQLGLARVS